MSYLGSKNKSVCSGCGACFNACSHGAIVMEEDKEGFLYPRIVNSRCIGCGLCTKVCPYNSDQSNPSQNYQQSCFAVTSEHIEYAMKSATIGLCTMISEKIIEQGGVVFGVKLDEHSWRTSHIACFTKKDLEGIRNSKYVQSDTNETFKQVKQLLHNRKKVLYIGTPCQIAGLKGFLMRSYDGLITIDLVCHGAYSYKLLREEVRFWEKKYGCPIFNFRFRSKRNYEWTQGGMINFDYASKRGKVNHIERHGSSSPTYRCYAYSPDGIYYNLRQSCYNCQFRQKNRYGDITIGDAWGNILDKNPQLNNKHNIKYGVSLLLCNTLSSQTVKEMLGNLVSYTPLPREQAFSQAALIPADREIPLMRDKIYNSIGKIDYGELLESFFGHSMDYYQRLFRINVLRQKVKDIIKILILYKKWY